MYFIYIMSHRLNLYTFHLRGTESLNMKLGYSCLVYMGSSCTCSYKLTTRMLIHNLHRFIFTCIIMIMSMCLHDPGLIHKVYSNKSTHNIPQTYELQLLKVPILIFWFVLIYNTHPILQTFHWYGNNTVNTTNKVRKVKQNWIMYVL